MKRKTKWIKQNFSQENKEDTKEIVLVCWLGWRLEQWQLEVGENKARELEEGGDKKKKGM